MSSETDRGSVFPLPIERRPNTFTGSLSWKSGCLCAAEVEKHLENVSHIGHREAGLGARVPAPDREAAVPLGASVQAGTVSLSPTAWTRRAPCFLIRPLSYRDTVVSFQHRLRTLISLERNK